MLNLQRQRNYARQRGVQDGLIVPYPAQFRRMKHKSGSRKTHPHEPVGRCRHCRPFPVIAL